MTEKMKSSEVGFSETNLIEVLQTYGVNRRSILKLLGGGAALTLASGTVSAGHEQPDPPYIDSYYGYSSPCDARLPRKLQPNHEVDLHIDFTEGMEDTNPPFFHFEPTGLHVEPGDIVRFNFTTPDHTITALHNGHGRQQRVPEGVPPFSSPIINIGGFWLYQFDVEGLYDIVCAPHELFGMAMRIVVGDLAEGDVPAYEDDFVGDDPEMFRPPISKEEIEFFLNAFGQQECVWPFLTSSDVLSTDALDPDVIQAEGSVPFSDVAAELGYE